MIKKYVSVETAKMVGDAGLRIGKDIVREGTKVVVTKSIATAVGAALAEGVDGIKKIKLDDILGDETRKARKLEKRKKKIERKNKKREAKEEMKGLNVFKEEFETKFREELETKLEEKSDKDNGEK